MKIMSVVGARPNFMKIAPFCRALAKHPEVTHILVHTGQHYDVRMSDSFFVDLGIPEPDVHLNIGSGSHAEQVGRTMIEFEKVVRAENRTGSSSSAMSMPPAPVRSSPKWSM